MTVHTFGEVSWDSIDSNSNKKKINTKELFLNLQNGDNEVRIVTSPFKYNLHKYKAEGDKGFGRKILCSATKENPECPLCELQDKVKSKMYIGVIDRKSNSYKIIDASSVIGQQLKTWVNNKRYGDPRGYDINIVVNKNGGATGYYTVQAYGKEPLSAEDQAIIDRDVDLEYLKRISTPLDAETVLEKMKKLDEQFSGSGVANAAPVAVEATAKSTSKKKAAPVPVAEESEEFEDYN